MTKLKVYATWNREHDGCHLQYITSEDNTEAQKEYDNSEDGWYPSVVFQPTLTWCLTIIHGDEHWRNPLHPYMFSSRHVTSPFEAYQELKPEFQEIVKNLLGRDPRKEDE